jgi:FAD/FMN-containing dehydrogenase
VVSTTLLARLSAVQQTPFSLIWRGTSGNLTTMKRRPIESVVTELSEFCDGTLISDSSECEAYSRDFGGMVRRHPALVFRPAKPEDVVTALKIAAAHEVPIATRGAGHSQAGQCLGNGLVLDMRSLCRVLGISNDHQLIEVEAGIRWRAVVDTTVASQLLPRGLTHVLDTTVAGTLSVAGVGSESWRFGPQVDNVAYLDVATLNGEVHRASVTSNRELFDAARAGLGQSGVILRVGYPVRPCLNRIHSRYFVYRAADRFMNGVEVACARGPKFLFGSLMRETSGNWVLLLVLGFEYAETYSADAFHASELEFDVELPRQDAPLWDKSGVPGHLFFRLHAPSPTSLDADPATLHPWVEHVFPRAGALEVLNSFLADRSGLLGLGTNGIIIVRRTADPAPLFVTPPGEGLAWGIGVFPSVAPWFREDAEKLLSSHAARGKAAGGKRYLSGFVRANESSAWAEHYGEAWQFFRQAKARFDPPKLLNAGFIDWS